MENEDAPQVEESSTSAPLQERRFKALSGALSEYVRPCTLLPSRGVILPYCVLASQNFQSNCIYVTAALHSKIWNHRMKIRSLQTEQKNFWWAESYGEAQKPSD